jgi:RNA polymerase sigma-70 factor (ECF subfamily)
MSRFATTRWSQVRRAGTTSPSGRQALSWLCEAYWQALYKQAQRRGFNQDQAQDVVQSFLTMLMERGPLSADPERGRFRTWLLTAFWHHLADVRDGEAAHKRGGHIAHERLSTVEVAGAETSDSAGFDRDWALTLLDRALQKLAAEQSAKDAERFAVLRPFLTITAPAPDYSVVAQKLGLPSGAVRVAVHRLRERFGELVRAEIAETVEDPSRPHAIEDELAALKAALGRG